MQTAFIVLLVGMSIIASILIKSVAERTGLTPIIGYMGLGFLLHVFHLKWEPVLGQTVSLFEILAVFGIICLLFRIGLESDLPGLRKQLRPAGGVWIGSFFLSGLLAFIAAYSWLELDLVPSLFVGTALTATSIGIPLAIWKEACATESANGELLLDVAEMDDISGVILMALLLAMAPALKSGAGTTVAPVLLRTATWFFFKALLFGVFCYLFSRYAEKRLAAFFRKIEPTPDPMLMVAGVGFIIAALAEILGFSLAIGAFFAGLTFSSDPETVKMAPSFSAVYDFFTPFFFIGVGLSIDPVALLNHLDTGLILLAAAVVGKFLGTAGPVLPIYGGVSALLLGISMLPRAEIALIIMQRGSDLGDWAVPSSVYGATVFVSAVTCLVAPLALRPLFTLWPQTGASGTPRNCDSG
ncbi:MAG: cation:proton antiporter [Desulfohalobiaceae bacterium]|nr:cation:proton antiporter [Desulfohalobiaceae bacterium]